MLGRRRLVVAFFALPEKIVDEALLAVLDRAVHRTRSLLTIYRRFPSQNTGSLVLPMPSFSIKLKHGSV